jgi:hypothetical protein
VRRTLIILTTLLALGGCATHSEPKPAVCDGKHRRPANPYGSVLPSIPGGSTPTPPAAAPATPPPPGPQSSLDPRSFGPCGGTA